MPVKKKVVRKKTVPKKAAKKKTAIPKHSTDSNRDEKGRWIKGNSSRKGKSNIVSRISKKILEADSAELTICVNGENHTFSIKGDGQAPIGASMVMAQIIKALKGDIFAFNAISDRVEGKPVQKVLEKRMNLDTDDVEISFDDEGDE